MISTFRPRLSNTELVFESTNGLAGRNFTTGQSSNGAQISNVRVTCNVSAIDDSERFARQLGFVIVTNAYPIA